ncbi:MAG: SRPBCC domain-containing protein [Planctomycetes bacterium]|nr:SRPBCC domain-containing protein [Planctomycetota bacterium]
MHETVEARVTHQFPMAADRVYDAWLDPAQVRQWLAGALRSHGLPGEIVRVEIDARVGGSFFFSDRRPQMEARHWGQYLVLDRPRQIQFTWIVDESEAEQPSQVTLTLHPTGTGCTADLVHSMNAAWRDYIPQTQAGWSRMLQHVEQLLASAPKVN